ncbi:MAG: glycosyltransferase family 39 protein [Bacteroidota bacterium]
MQDKTSNFLLVSTILLLLVGYFSSLSTLELRAEEPRRAVVAMEMYYSGDWIVPKIHGWNYYNKPPLFNWVVAAHYALFGSTAEWVVRLPSLLAWWMTALLLFFFTRRHLSTTTAIIAALLLLSFGDILYYGSIHSGEIDLFFSSLIFLQIVAIFHFGQSKKYGLLFGISYLLTASAFLTKGMPALAFQALTLLVYFIAHRNWKGLFSWQHILGIFLFFVVLGSYCYAYEQEANVFAFLTNLLKESTQRSISEHQFGAIAAQFLLFFPNLLKLLLPWSLALLLLFKKSIRQLVWKNNLTRFCSLFILANLWLYALSPGTLNRYLYPFFPFFAIILAYTLMEHQKIKYRHLLYALLFLGVVRIGYNFILLPKQQATLKQTMYRDLNETLWDITEGEKIYWTGAAYKWEARPSFFGLTIASDSLQSPPLLPYQIPYYLEHTGKYIFEFHPEARTDTYYLAYKKFVANKEVEIFYTFTELWTKQEMVLVKFL